MIRLRCPGCMEILTEEYNICPHCGYMIDSAPAEPIYLQPGTIFHNRYIIGKALGSGGFGVTYLAWDGKLEQKVAIKEYMPGEFSTRAPGQSTVTVFSGDRNEQFYAGMHKFNEEAKKLAKFKNEDGIVKIFDSFEENGTAYIIMEYLEGMTLSDYLKEKGTIPEDDAVALMMPVMKSLGKVHNEGILHRDIAPDNIFVTKKGEFKLIDFGASRFATTTHSRSLTVMIKPGYSAEEQYRSRGDQGTHTDVYSLAATMYKMITGHTPPDAMERRAKYENQNKDILEPPHKYVKDLSRAREVAILNGMNVRVEDRTPDIDTFISELEADPPAKRRYGKIKKLDLYTWPLWLKIGIGSLLLILLAFGVLLATGAIKFTSNYSNEIVMPENMVEVPDVEGLTNNEALKLIEEAKLVAQATGNIESKYVEAGKIVFQNPSAGLYVNINSIVALTVSSGSGEIIDVVDGKATVPYVIWDEKNVALEKLEMSGLGEPNISESYDDNVSEGLVISQSIDAGTEVEEGTVIDIVISLGPKPFAMPNVVGKQESEAESILGDKALGIKKEYRESSDVEEGTVLEQSLKPDELVVRGTEVTITVASKVSTVKVENVVGKPSTEAISILEKQGFKVKETESYSDEVKKDIVISQNPAAGTEQTPDTVITILISKGAQEVKVKLDALGGEVSPSEITVVYGGTYAVLPEAKRNGYYFGGWYSDKDGGSLITSTSQVTNASEHTLYARWSNSQYVVEFDGKGGNISFTSKNVAFGLTYGDLPTAERNGFDFKGWYTAETGGERIIKDTKVNITSNQVLYAHWGLRSYNLKFDANGGTVSEGSRKLTFGSAYGELPVASRAGYAFAGWYTSASGGNQVTKDTKIGSSDVSVYAHWSKNAITVTVLEKGDDGAELGNYTIVKEYGTSVSVSPKDHAGYTAPAAQKVTWDNNKTITFTYKINSYTVTVTEKGDNGKALGNYTLTEKYGTTKTVSPQKYTGYTAPAAQKVTWDGNKTITFTYSTNLYTVTIVEQADNGTALGTYTLTEKYGTSKTISPNTYTGYTAPAAQKIKWNSNKTVTFAYTANIYTVTFDGNGGSTPASIQVTYGGTFGKLPTCTRDYYTFDGWYTAANGGKKVKSTTAVSITSNLTLYAHWTENGWGEWSEWSTNAVSAETSGGIEVRKIESKQVLVSYYVRSYLTQDATNYSRCYRSFSLNGNYSAYGARPSYGEKIHEETMPADKTGFVAISPGDWSQGYDYGKGINKDSITGYYTYEAIIYFIVSENYEAQYRYCDRIK